MEINNQSIKKNNVNKFSNQKIKKFNQDNKIISKKSKIIKYITDEFDNLNELENFQNDINSKKEKNYYLLGNNISHIIQPNIIDFDFLNDIDCNLEIKNIFHYNLVKIINNLNVKNIYLNNIEYRDDEINKNQIIQKDKSDIENNNYFCSDLEESFMKNNNNSINYLDKAKDNIEYIEKNTEFVGFKTALGNNIKIEKKNFDKADKLIKEIEKVEIFKETIINNSKNQEKYKNNNVLINKKKSKYEKYFNNDNINIVYNFIKNVQQIKFYSKKTKDKYNNINDLENKLLTINLDKIFSPINDLNYFINDLDKIYDIIKIRKFINFKHFSLEWFINNTIRILELIDLLKNYDSEYEINYADILISRYYNEIIIFNFSYLYTISIRESNINSFSTYFIRNIINNKNNYLIEITDFHYSLYLRIDNNNDIKNNDIINKITNKYIISGRFISLANMRFYDETYNINFNKSIDILNDNIEIKMNYNSYCINNKVNNIGICTDENIFIPICNINSFDSIFMIKIVILEISPVYISINSFTKKIFNLNNIDKEKISYIYFDVKFVCKYDFDNLNNNKIILHNLRIKTKNLNLYFDIQSLDSLRIYDLIRDNDDDKYFNINNNIQYDNIKNFKFDYKITKFIDVGLNKEEKIKLKNLKDYFYNNPNFNYISNNSMITFKAIKVYNYDNMYFLKIDNKIYLKIDMGVILKNNNFDFKEIINDYIYFVFCFIFIDKYDKHDDILIFNINFKYYPIIKFYKKDFPNCYKNLNVLNIEIDFNKEKELLKNIL